jgi:acyl-CoA synthetase (NDP forming)
MSPDRSLRPLFAPSSVAVLGASEDPRKWGHWLARGALTGEDRRPVYLINRRAGELLGRRAYRSLTELPGPAELVVIAVPIAALSGAVDAALAGGARAIVAISAGSSDGPEARALETALAARVRQAGAVMLGPNCLGVLDSAEQLELSSNPLPAGAVGLISQSGNLALELGQLAAAEGLGFSRFASLGNQADLTAADLVADFAGHDETRLIMLYVEDFRDGRALMRAALQARTNGKAVLALAVSDDPATGRAARSHTGALASDGATIDAACRAVGVERVNTPREMVDAAQALLRCPPARGRRVVVLSDGGGHSSIGAAVAAQAGLEIPELPAALADSLGSQLPPGAAVLNPIDLAGGAEKDTHTFARVAAEVLAEPELDAMLLTGYFGGYAEYGPELELEEMRAAEAIGEVSRTTGKPIVAHTMYPRGAAADALRSAGVAVYEAIEQAGFALGQLVEHGTARTNPAPPIPDAAPPVGHDGYAAARELLADAGIPFVAQRTVRDLESALAAATEIGYPVVLKALRQLHKSDAGGVVLGIADADSLARAYDDVRARLAPAACSIERSAPVADGVELLIGTRWDARFGPVALVGAGGVYTEVLRDTAVTLAPVTEAQAESMLRSLRVSPLLLGARGRPSLNLAAAARALAVLSGVAAAHPELAELEINPLLVTPDEAIALDARFIRAIPTQESRKCSSPTRPSSLPSAIAPTI